MSPLVLHHCLYSPTSLSVTPCVCVIQWRCVTLLVPRTGSRTTPSSSAASVLARSVLCSSCITAAPAVKASVVRALLSRGPCHLEAGITQSASAPPATTSRTADPCSVRLSSFPPHFLHYPGHHAVSVALLTLSVKKIVALSDSILYVIEPTEGAFPIRWNFRTESFFFTLQIFCNS